MPLAVLMLGVAQWSLSYALSLAQVSLSAQIFWANLTYIGIGLVPASWLAFALEYIGQGSWAHPAQADPANDRAAVDPGDGPDKRRASAVPAPRSSWWMPVRSWCYSR